MFCETESPELGQSASQNESSGLEVDDGAEEGAFDAGDVADGVDDDGTELVHGVGFGASDHIVGTHGDFGGEHLRQCDGRSGNITGRSDLGLDQDKRVDCHCDRPPWGEDIQSPGTIDDIGNLCRTNPDGAFVTD